jgi:hypothetical protein
MSKSELKGSSYYQVNTKSKLAEIDDECYEKQDSILIDFSVDNDYMNSFVAQKRKDDGSLSYKAMGMDP